MLQFINFSGKETPVSFSMMALTEWADKVGKPVEDLFNRLDSLSAYETLWLGYSGMKWGSMEFRGREPKMTIVQYAEHVEKHPDDLTAIFEAFGKHIQVLAKLDDDGEKKTQSPPIETPPPSPGDTTVSAREG